MDFSKAEGWGRRANPARAMFARLRLATVPSGAGIQTQVLGNQPVLLTMSHFSSFSSEFESYNAFY